MGIFHWRAAGLIEAKLTWAATNEAKERRASAQPGSLSFICIVGFAESEWRNESDWVRRRLSKCALELRITADGNLTDLLSTIHFHWSTV